MTNGTLIELAGRYNNNLVLVGNNDSNVGIGTTTPYTVLDVRNISDTTIIPLSAVPDTSVTMLIGNAGVNGVLAIQINLGYKVEVY
jgi:hypothetical protein